MWLCVSMIPGMRNRPRASITVTPLGAGRFLPILSILPLRTSTSVSGIVGPEPGSTVAPRMRTLPPVFSVGRRSASISEGTHVCRLATGVSLPSEGFLPSGSFFGSGFFSSPLLARRANASYSKRIAVREDVASPR